MLCTEKHATEKFPYLNASFSKSPIYWRLCIVKWSIAVAMQHFLFSSITCSTLGFRLIFCTAMTFLLIQLSMLVGDPQHSFVAKNTHSNCFITILLLTFSSLQAHPSTVISQIPLVQIHTLFIPFSANNLFFVD